MMFNMVKLVNDVLKYIIFTCVDPQDVVILSDKYAVRPTLVSAWIYNNLYYMTLF